MRWHEHTAKPAGKSASQTVIMNSLLLTINPGTGQTVQVELPPGTYTIGREATNSIVIDHPSVVGFHAELEVEGSAARIRCLDSAAGLFLDGQRVQETEVPSGKAVAIGSATLTLFSLPPRMPMQAFPKPAPAPAVVPATPQTFFGQVPGAFGYPLHSELWFLILVVTGLEFLAALFPAGPMQFLSFPLGLIIGFGLFTLCQAIIHSTARGEAQLPTLPFYDFDWESAKETFGRYFILGFLCFAPATVSRLFPGLPGWYHPLAIALGAGYFPMAFLGLVITESLSAANPVTVIRSIAAAPAAYTVLVLFLGVFLTVTFAWEPAITVTKVSWFVSFGQVLLGAASMYITFVWMRLLGLFYRFYQAQLKF